MSITRVFGVLLLAAGAVLIIIGIADSRSVADHLSTFFRGHMTQQTLFYIIGGIVAAVVGLILTVGNFGRARS